MFPSLDAKLNAALARVTTGELGRRINLQKERYALQEKYLKGRQVLWLIFEFYKVADVEGGINSMRDLLSVAMRGDNLTAFMNDWETTIMNMKTQPDEVMLTALFFQQIHRHPGLRDHMAYLERLPSDHKERQYPALFDLVRKHLELKLRQRNRDDLARGRGQGRPAAPAKETKKGICRQFEAHGNCARGNSRAFAHVGSGRALSPKGKGKGKGKSKGKSRSKSKGRGKGKPRSRSGSPARAAPCAPSPG